MDGNTEINSGYLIIDNKFYYSDETKEKAKKILMEYIEKTNKGDTALPEYLKAIEQDSECRINDIDIIAYTLLKKESAQEVFYSNSKR